MLVSAANMADRDPAEHMVVISRGEGEGRIERELKNKFIKFQFSFFFSNLKNELKIKISILFIFWEIEKRNLVSFFSKI